MLDPDHIVSLPLVIRRGCPVGRPERQRWNRVRVALTREAAYYYHRPVTTGVAKTSVFGTSDDDSGFGWIFLEQTRKASFAMSQYLAERLSFETSQRRSAQGRVVLHL